MKYGSRIIKISFGAGIPLSAVVTTLVFGVFSLVVSIELPLLGIPLAVIFFGAASNRTGIIIDLQEDKFMQYSTFWAYRIGKWKRLTSYIYLSLEVNIEGSRLQINYTGIGTNRFTKKYDVILVSKDLRKRLIVSRHTSMELAKKSLKVLIEQTGRSYVSLDPEKNSILKSRIKDRRR